MPACSSVVVSLALKQIWVAQRNRKRVRTKVKRLATLEAEIWRRKVCKAHAIPQWSSLPQRGTQRATKLGLFLVHP